MPRRWGWEWAQRKSQLVHSLFEKKFETFSPIEEEHQLSSSAIAEPTLRSLSPLPDLIIEREENPHDESKEFYEGFEARMLRLYRRIFHLEESDDNLSDEEIDEDVIEETYINSSYLADDERPEDLGSVYCICDDDDAIGDQTCEDKLSEGGISESEMNSDNFNDCMIIEDQFGENHYSEAVISEDQINDSHLNDVIVNEDKSREDPITSDYRNEVNLDQTSEAVIREDQVYSDHLNDVVVNRKDLSEEGIRRERIRGERVSGLEISEGQFGEHQDRSGHGGLIDRQVSAGTHVARSEKERVIEIEEMRRLTVVPALHSSFQNIQYFSDDSRLLQTSSQKRAGALSSTSDEMELDTASDSFLLNEWSSCFNALSRKRSSSFISEEPPPKRTYKDVGVQTVAPQAVEWENLMRDFFRGRGRLYRCLL